MSGWFGWSLLAVNVLVGGYDLWRAMTFAAADNFGMTFVYVMFTSIMAWCARIQLHHMRTRGSR